MHARGRRFGNSCPHHPCSTNALQLMTMTGATSTTWTEGSVRTMKTCRSFSGRRSDRRACHSPERVHCALGDRISPGAAAKPPGPSLNPSSRTTPRGAIGVHHRMSRWLPEQSPGSQANRSAPQSSRCRLRATASGDARPPLLYRPPFDPKEWGPPSRTPPFGDRDKRPPTRIRVEPRRLPLARGRLGARSDGGAELRSACH